MPGWTKLEQRRVVEWRKKQIYRTEHVKFQWFEIAKQPELYTLDQNDCMWVATCDDYYGPTAPSSGENQ